MSMANSVETSRGNEVLALLLLALAGYLLPWVTAPNSAMTLNAFDLAEWTSLHPLQQQVTPPLIVPLLLRVQLPILAILITLWSTSRNKRFLAFLFLALLSVSQLPPLEFLNNVADPNYRQLLFLAIATILLSTGLGFILPGQFRPFVIIFLAVTGIVTSLLGQSQAIELYQVTLEQGETGGGLWLIVGAYAASSLNLLRRILRRR
ncbi:MAG: hypothetical protein OXG60_01615 [Chloroflexi bacterium]|nr:hypothetical protein [Chloroflexota bacterium]